MVLGTLIKPRLPFGAPRSRPRTTVDRRARPGAPWRARARAWARSSGPAPASTAWVAPWSRCATIEKKIGQKMRRDFLKVMVRQIVWIFKGSFQLLCVLGFPDWRHGYKPDQQQPEALPMAKLLNDAIDCQWWKQWQRASVFRWGLNTSWRRLLSRHYRLHFNEIGDIKNHDCNVHLQTSPGVCSKSASLFQVKWCG